MEKFNELKEKILRVAKNQSACSEQYKRAYSSKTIHDLCTVIRDNFHWCCNHSVLTPEIIETYKADFAENGIYHNENVSGAYLIASGSSTVRAYGSSTVIASDSSTVRAYGSSYVNNYSLIECKISGKAILRHNGVVSCCGKSIKTK